MINTWLKELVWTLYSGSRHRSYSRLYNRNNTSHRCMTSITGQRRAPRPRPVNGWILRTRITSKGLTWIRPHFGRKTRRASRKPISHSSATSSRTSCNRLTPNTEWVLLNNHCRINWSRIPRPCRPWSRTTCSRAQCQPSSRHTTC